MCYLVMLVVYAHAKHTSCNALPDANYWTQINAFWFFNFLFPWFSTPLNNRTLIESIDLLIHPPCQGCCMTPTLSGDHIVCWTLNSLGECVTKSKPCAGLEEHVSTCCPVFLCSECLNPLVHTDIIGCLPGWLGGDMPLLIMCANRRWSEV